MIMADWHAPQGQFDIPDVPDWVPRRLKPWIFIFFVLIVQFSGGVYLAAATDMVGTTALMQEDILMAGYASLIGMAINFAVMFRFKFRFSNRTQLLAAGIVLIAANILGFDETNLIDLNWYVLGGIVAGCGFTYYTFALRKWRFKTMSAIGFALAAAYLCYFYLLIDYGVEKEMLFIPLFFRGAASVIISIVFLTSIVQSGLPFQVFPQALTINGFTGAVMGATLGPAIIGELLRHVMAKNASLLGSVITDFNPDTAHIPLQELFGLVQTQALAVSMKEIFGWLLIVALLSLLIILLSYSSLRPNAIFPKWKTVRRVLRHVVRMTPIRGTARG